MKQLNLWVFCLFASITAAFAQPRQEIIFTDQWQFSGADVTGNKIEETVNLPHTWNATDAQQGIPYYRGEGRYVKTFTPETAWQNKRVFIRFEGVMSRASVSLNGNQLGEHRGGYSAFCYELTPFIRFGEENHLEVLASNAETTDILPLAGDFNLYGGIYRPVKLLITSKTCISPLDYASSGIYLKQKLVSERQADVELSALISHKEEQATLVLFRSTVFDAEGNIVLTADSVYRCEPGEQTLVQNLHFDNPHLWKGHKDPYLYRVRVQLYRQNQVIEELSEPLGLRYFHITPTEGFFLNGLPYPLRGVCRHQDWQDKGSALSAENHKEDVELILEMGANTVRLAHYQQAGEMYSRSDSAGLVVWAEIPFVGMPDFGGGSNNGYNTSTDFRQNARQQLTELIRQNYNHPSICFWGLFNEIQNPKEASPVELVKELQALAKTEDPTRITTAASMLDAEEPIHDITDVIAWNKYFGWYYNDPEDIGEWLDKIHEKYPSWSIAISEYGAGASIYQHQIEPERPNPFGSPHPEEWQNEYHESHFQAFKERPYIWGTFLWNMFDFGSHFRREGDHPGRNDKGLVTYNRKVKKDAFYFYKANWSEEAVLYITSRRFILRNKKTTPVKVYANTDEVELWVNRESKGKVKGVNGVFLWEDISLQPGNNAIKVTGKKNGKNYEDTCIWVLESRMNLVIAIFDLIPYLKTILIAGFFMLIYLWRTAYGRRKRKRKEWKTRIWKIFFYLFLLAMILLSAVQVILWWTGMGR
ncbi:MAG: glycoside hydrolase family 2 TIM barrel-domain containing protein [Bacteroidia bacterium]|nr:glycoside hydrolase family 2 TIM barrel-domain containing protein [Bacteroidia bacterium]